MPALPSFSDGASHFVGTSPSVVIVDDSSESREVLRAALERRGLTIFEASEARQGLSLVRRHHPHVVVLDLDATDAHEETVQAEYAAESAAADVPLVILGRAREYSPKLPDDRVVAKPYHYAPLIRKIEQLVEQNRMP